MTDQERIDRLEQMVVTLSDTVKSLTQIVNTGSYEYSLDAVRIALHDIKEFKLPAEPEVITTDWQPPPPPPNDLLVIMSAARSGKTMKNHCLDSWHTAACDVRGDWCSSCGKSV